MLVLMLVIGMTAQSATGTAKQAAPSAVQATPAPSATKTTDIDAAALLKVKRIYVDSFGEDIISKEIQSIP